MIDHALTGPDDLDAPEDSRLRAMRGVPTLDFRIAYEGGIRLVPNVLNSGEEARLRAYALDHASQIADAFLDLFERWLER